MISLSRTLSATDIHANFKTPKRENFEVDLMDDQRAVLKGTLNKHDFKSDRWKQAKDELKKDTHNKCAYCEAPTSVVAYGDVEHFRPKSKYWWLAYCYDNFLVSCQLCNQKFKGAKFPKKNAKLKSPVSIRKNTADAFIQSKKGQLAPDPLNATDVAAFKLMHLTERPFLVNPYFEKPENFYAWEADDSLRQVKLIAKPGLSDGDKYVKEAEDVLGLNRIELLELRYSTLQIFRTFESVLSDLNISANTRTLVRDQMDQMQANVAPFAGMIRFFA